MAVGFFMPAILGSSALPPITWAFVASNSASTTNFTVPAAAQAGDLCVVFQRSSIFNSVSSYVTPSGWTSAAQAATAPGFTNIAGMLIYKVLGSGDPGSTFTGMADTTRKIVLVFRPSRAVTSIVVTGANAEALASGSHTIKTVDPTAAGVGAILIGAASNGTSSGSISTSGSLVANGVFVSGSTANTAAYYELENSILGSRTFTAVYASGSIILTAAFGAI